MQGIYIAAIITTLIAVLLIGGFLFGLSRKEERPHLLTAFLLTLPMSILAFHLVRMPLDRWLAGILAGNTELLGFLRTFYAPLTEEPAKLWPLLIPWFLRRLKRENFVLVALALGLGFGVSEAWLIAELIARHNPEIASMPWYALGGYINERTMVCIMHGFFTSVALLFLTRPADRDLHEIAPQAGHNWRAFALGLLAAMGLHYLANFPIYLVALLTKVWPGVSKVVWQVALTVWIELFFVGALILIIFLYARQGRTGKSGKKEGLLERLFGYARCPECGHVYPRPWYGANLSTFKKPTQRYEPCPACRKWHMTEALPQDEVERLRAEGKL